MFHNKSDRGAWCACAAAVVLLAAGCGSAGSEESGGASGGVVDSTSSTAADSPSSSLVGTVASSAASTSITSTSTSTSSSTTTSTTTTTTVLFGGGELGGGVAGTSGFVFEEVFSEEELAEWDEALSEEELAELAKAKLGMTFSIEVLLEKPDFSSYSDEYNAYIAALASLPNFSGYPDEYIAAWAFFMREVVDDDPFAIDSNDRSTPVGAFCWVVLSVSFASHLQVERPVPFMGSLQFLRLWHLEREAVERGLELDWDTGPVVGYVPSLEFVLEEVLAPDVRQMVFSPGLPQVLRPWAEALYVLLEEWSALPVVDVPRPTVDDFLSGDEGSPYRGFEGITEEEIAWIWPWDSEVILSTEEIDELEALVRGMDIEEVRSVVDSECKFRVLGGMLENACPPWVAEVVGYCDLSEEDEPRWGSLADLYE